MAQMTLHYRTFIGVKCAYLMHGQFLVALIQFGAASRHYAFVGRAHSTLTLALGQKGSVEVTHFLSLGGRIRPFYL